MPDLRRLSILLFFFHLVSTAYFTQKPLDYFSGGWNQKSRFNLVRALVEQKTVSIDAYHLNTGDKSYRDGHYYSDKAPGLSVIAYPFYLPIYWIERTFFPGELQKNDPPSGFNLWWVTFWTVMLPSSLLVVVLFRLTYRITGNLRGAFWTAFVYGFGTLAFPFSSIFVGHQPAGAFAFFAFASAYYAFTSDSRWRLLLSGFLAGLAIAIEFPLTLFFLLLLGYIGLKAFREKSSPLSTTLLYLAGSVPVAIFLLTYNAVAFGNPFHISYEYVARPEFATGQAGGFFGFHLPRWKTFLHLLIGPYRGLFFFSPVLLSSFAGIYRGIKKRTAIAEILFCFSYFFLTLLLNSGYYAWEGGNLIGPRHLVVSLPFLSACISFYFTERISPAFFFLFLLSFLNMTALRLAEIFPEAYYNPLWDVAYKGLFQGEAMPIIIPALKGFTAILPLLALLLMMFQFLHREHLLQFSDFAGVAVSTETFYAILYVLYGVFLLNQSSLYPAQYRIHTGIRWVNEKMFEAGFFQSYLEKLERNPEDVEANAVAGLYYFRRHEFQQALPYLEKAYQGGIHDPFLYRMLAGVYLMQNETEKALKILHQFLKDFPENPDRGEVEGLIQRLTFRTPAPEPGSGNKSKG